MRTHSTLWVAVAALCGVSTLAQAAPPTVTPSPGYDARLQEQRAATHGTTTTFAPVTPGNPPPPTRRHGKKKHAN
jgi:hypothetical protein